MLEYIKRKQLYYYINLPDADWYHQENFKKPPAKN